MSFINGKGIIILFGSLTVLFFIIGGVGPVIMNAVLKNGVEDGLIYKEDNYEDWGQTPGNSGVPILRRFTADTLTNPLDVIFNGVNPILQESEEMVYYEVKNSTEIELEQDGKVIAYNTWERYLPATDKYGTTGEEELTILNIGPLGVWEASKKSVAPSLALSTFSSIFYSLNDNLYTSIIAGAMASAPFPTNIGNILTALVGEGATAAQSGAIGADTIYGMNSNGMTHWVEICLGDVSADATTVAKLAPGTKFAQIQNYFGLSYAHMEYLHEEFYTNCVLPAYSGVIKTTICDGNGLPASSCTRETISAMQWTTSGIIAGGLGAASATVYGHVELSNYYTNIFSAGDSSSNPFFVSDNAVFNVVFSLPWAMKVMSYKTDGTFTTDVDALLHIGNQAELFIAGDAFDKSGDSYASSPHLQAIMDKFQLESLEHTMVFWQYCKYVVAVTAMNAAEGGDQASAAVGGFIAPAIEAGFQGMQDLLYPGLSAALISGAVASVSCVNYWQLGSIFSAAQATQLCTNLFAIGDDDNLTQEHIMKLHVICHREQEAAYQGTLTLLDAIGSNEGALTGFCDNIFIAQQEKGVNEMLATHYSCTTPTTAAFATSELICSNFEFAAIQWASGAVTKNPHANLILGGFTAKDSVADWFPTYFAKPIEFYGVAKSMEDTFTAEGDSISTTLTLTNAKALLNSNTLLSSTQIGRGFTRGMNSQLQTQFEDIFGTDIPIHQLLTYFRYIAIEWGFGGMLIKKPLKEAYFGYDDPILTKINQNNPQKGGNPSVATKATIGSASTTYEGRLEKANRVKLYTGKGDIDKVGKYYELYGQHEYIASYDDVFNGNETISNVEYIPWEKEIPYYGHGGGQSHPFQEEGDTNAVFVSGLYKEGKLKQKGSKEQWGLDVFRYELIDGVFDNEETNPENKGQYGFGPNGLLNLTKVAGAPMFNTRTHFYKCDEELYKNVTILNKDGNVQQPNKYDETFVHSEKWTGVSLEVALNVQLNYEMKPDILFPVPYTRYIPVFSMLRGANWTQAQIDDKFGGLKAGLTVKLVLLILGCTLGGICLCITLGLAIRFKSMQNQQAIKIKNLEGEKLDYEQANPIDTNNNLPEGQQITTENPEMIQQTTENL